MSEKYKGKYRHESARLKNWDYGSNAAYFITICTQNRECYFGDIRNGEMKVSPAGAIAHTLWVEIKNHTKNIELGEFVVMPNHIHGILIIDGNIYRNGGDDANNRDIADMGRDVACHVPTITGNEKMSAISPKSNTVSTIIRSYKSAVTKYCNQLDIPFAWQPRFYDHIIRNDASFHNISKYIKNNPSKWKEDSLK